MKTFSAHKIKDRYDIPFPAIEYSKFKFGCKDMAKKFGYDLADAFIKHLQENPIENQIVICSSPYCFIPTATFAMKDYFVQKLNDYLVSKSLLVIQETKIHRTITYKEDYGSLSSEDRMKLIGSDGFHVDKEFIVGKTVIFLDDIKITGSHERVIQRMCDEYRLDSNSYYMFLYFAELTNSDIHPSIENELNYAYVKNLLDLDSIIKNENFLLNTRVVKFILNSSYEEFVNFIHYQRKSLASTIYHQAIGNSYHLIEDYKINLNYLKLIIK